MQYQNSLSLMAPKLHFSPLLSRPPGRPPPWSPGSRRSRASYLDQGVTFDIGGEFRVLQDNVRVPSGVSYVMTNRRAISAAPRTK
ncbi:hypothetical protein NPS01_32240 [Nocardioides psychrotolerans]|nr:hypothetical protein NPS01_32240 [Nocardioides psychrotolerans]